MALSPSAQPYALRRRRRGPGAFRPCIRSQHPVHKEIPAMELSNAHVLTALFSLSHCIALTPDEMAALEERGAHPSPELWRETRRTLELADRADGPTELRLGFEDLVYLWLGVRDEAGFVARFSMTIEQALALDCGHLAALASSLEQGKGSGAEALELPLSHAWSERAFRLMNDLPETGELVLLTLERALDGCPWKPEWIRPLFEAIVQVASQVNDGDRERQARKMLATLDADAPAGATTPFLVGIAAQLLTALWCATHNGLLASERILARDIEPTLETWDEVHRRDVDPFGAAVRGRRARGRGGDSWGGLAHPLARGPGFVKVGEKVQGRLWSTSPGSGLIRHWPYRDGPDHDAVDLEVVLEEVDPYRLVFGVRAHGREFDELPVDSNVALAPDLFIHAPDDDRAGAGMTRLAYCDEVPLPGDFAHVRLFHHQAIVRPCRKLPHEGSRDAVADPALVEERLLVADLSANFDDWHFVEVHEPQPSGHPGNYLDLLPQNEPPYESVGSGRSLEVKCACALGARRGYAVLRPKLTNRVERLELSGRQVVVVRPAAPSPARSFRSSRHCGFLSCFGLPGPLLDAIHSRHPRRGAPGGAKEQRP